jgi:DNA modification methylase
VLDPFAGSGTTGVVAARLQRPFTIIDRSDVAIATARKRLAEANVPLAILKADTAAAS